MPVVRRSTLAAVSALGACLLAAPGARAGSYTFQRIVNSGDPTFNELLGINDAGTIAGYFGIGLGVPGQPNQGYTTAPPYSAFPAENYPGSVQTEVTGLNNGGVSVGFYANSNTGNDANFGFVDQHGAFTPVNDPNTPAGDPTPINQLLGVNDHDVAVGFYVDAAGMDQGFTYSIATGTFAPISIAGAMFDVVTGINDAGEISGYYGPFTGATLGFTEFVNGSGFTSFAAPGSNDTMFLGINNNGEAVGTYLDAAGNTHGLTYKNGTFANIDDPLAFQPGGTNVNGVNDRGQLVGFYGDAAGNVDGFLATPVPVPVPEPPAGATVAAALLLLGVARQARRRT